MAVEGIKISLGEVSATAGTIRTLNTSLNDKLLEIQKEMNDLAATWQSPAGETIRERFNGLVPAFENYKQIIESYAKFLDNTVSSYESTETQIQNNASAFK